MKPVVIRGIDWYLIGFSLLLVAIGLSIIYSIAIVRGSLSLVTGQVMALIIGIVIAWMIGAYDYRRMKPMVFIFYLLGITLLVAVLIWGDKVLGARRWISLGFFQLQPSEIMKLLVILVFARILSEAAEFRARSIIFLCVLAVIPIGIVLRQPDLGTAAVLGLTILFMLAAARLPQRYWWVLLLIVVISAPLAFANLKPYQRTRVETFLTPTKDPFGAGYNVIQSIIAVGNGGVFGQGIGQGTQSQLEFLPVAHTDFIFAGIAEATGLVGSTLVIALLASLCIRALLIAQRSTDRFGLFLAIGIGSLWLVQFSINIAMNLGLAPVTGIPLPFVSHGGSALVMNFIALGLLQSIAIRSHSRKIRVA